MLNLKRVSLSPIIIKLPLIFFNQTIISALFSFYNSVVVVAVDFVVIKCNYKPVEGGWGERV